MKREYPDSPLVGVGAVIIDDDAPPSLAAIAAKLGIPCARVSRSEDAASELSAALAAARSFAKAPR